MDFEGDRMSDTTVLTVSALDLGADKLVNYMKRVCRGFAVMPGHTQVQVKTPATLDPTGKGSILKGVYALDNTIRSVKGPKIVLAYSQGAQIAGAWLDLYGRRADAPPASELYFILIGNPERKFGKQPWTVNTTPTDTKYAVRDVARKGDNWADWQGQTTNRFRALFGKIHTNYWDTDIYDPAAEVVKVEGNTTFVRVP